MTVVSNSAGNPLIFNSGESIHSYNDAINGFLVDLDYFSNCGSGSSSNTTNNSSNIGDIQYWDGSTWNSISAGEQGTVLTMSENGIPHWSNPYNFGFGNYVDYTSLIISSSSSSPIVATTDGILFGWKGGNSALKADIHLSTATGQEIEIKNFNYYNDDATFNIPIKEGTSYYVIFGNNSGSFNFYWIPFNFY